MSVAAFAPNLQDTVDRFARSLTVPSALLDLHPRLRGNPGKHAALAPAITVGVVSAFEGFAEDFLAVVLYLQGQSFAQVTKKADLTNPSLADFKNAIGKDFPDVKPKLGVGFEETLWRPPVLGAKGWWKAEPVGWEQVLHESQAWIQVRHCLSHGLTSGWRTERWPGPATRGGSNSEVPWAKEVLRAMPGGKHSLVIHGAISCARIYRAGAVYLADLVAEQIGQKLSWTKVPEFPLGPEPKK